MQALNAKQKEIEIQSRVVPLSPMVAIFGTMNPSFPVLKKLPDNVQQLLWPVAMTIPDLAQIAEVILMYTGFRQVVIM